MIRLDEFNIKDLKFLKIKKNPQTDLKKSEITLGFLSYLYAKLLGQLVEKKGNIGIFYGKSINTNYAEYAKKKQSNSNVNAFQLNDFKYPFLSLIFYKSNPDTIVDAEEITLEYFRNIYTKYVKPQKPLKQFNFYNYYYLYSPESIGQVSLSDVIKTIKPTQSPKFKGGKIELATVFISNYLAGNIKKEFKLAVDEIKAFTSIDKLGSDKKTTPTETPKKEPEKKVDKNKEGELKDDFTNDTKKNIDKLQKQKDAKLKPVVTNPDRKEPPPEDPLMGKPMKIDLTKK